MDFELRAARVKLEKEQRERKEAARLRVEREKKAKAEAARRKEAIEAAQRIRRQDEARAQELEQLRMDAIQQIGGGIVFSRVLEASVYDGFGDKIKLPPSCFTELSDKGALDKGPMYFLLSRADGSASTSGIQDDSDGPHRSTHAGVLEFTAEEGSVQLPPHVWDNLFSDCDVALPPVEVRYASLPKGTYAKLQPIGVGFPDIPNHKAVLETGLRRHATLSQGDIITVKHGDLCYKLRVLELKPASSVSVIETDVEVDIVESDSDSESQNQYSLVPLVLGKSEQGTVGEEEFKYYKFSVDANLDERIMSGEFSVEVKLEAMTTQGDTDIYVSRHPVIFPTQHKHDWSSHDMGSKTLILSPKDQSTFSGTYSIGLFGFKGCTSYEISVAVKEKKKQKGEAVGVSGAESELDAVKCQNCRRYISRQSAMIHEAFCMRHNVTCQHTGCGIILRKEEAVNHVHCNKCGQGIKRQEMEKHMKVFHEPVACSCGIVLERKEMVEHQSATCPLRLITCRFCGDMVQAGSLPADARDRLRGLSEHESECGSRTAPCHSCGRSVMLKDMDIHMTAVHQPN